MDFDSVGDRPNEIQICESDNAENAEESMEEDPPPILSSVIREVFHVFANMLDIKSFMRLAMTSKTMYERCMMDKRIRINIIEKGVAIGIVNQVSTLFFHSFDVADVHKDNYLRKLRQLRCNVSLTMVYFQGEKTDIVTVNETRRYLKDIGVKNIESLKIDGESTGWQEISFITDFQIKNVAIGHGLSDQVLLSLLQSNLNYFSYDGRVQGEMLLDSPIPWLRLPSIRLSVDVLTQIIWRIQTGVLKKLSINFLEVPWRDFPSVWNDYDGPLPDGRPLLILNKDMTAYWFLHSNGDATKMAFRNVFYVELFKCEKAKDLPATLKSEESVHKELAEKHNRVYCHRNHFTSFFDGIPVLDGFHEGPFPEERPLLCKDVDLGRIKSYYLLKEDGSMDMYIWRIGYSVSFKYDMEKKWPSYVTGQPLQKFVFDKRIQKCVKEGTFECQNVQEFRFLFEDYGTLPHDFREQLPERRPLVFEGKLLSEEKKAQKENRVVLYEDGTLTQFQYENNTVNIKDCPPWNVPSMFLTPEHLRELVLKASFKDFVCNIDLDVFRDTFKGIKTLPLRATGDIMSDLPTIFKKNEFRDGEFIDQRWLALKTGELRRFEWRNGRAEFSKVDFKEVWENLAKYALL